jgi:hypothetical protein
MNTTEFELEPDDNAFKRFLGKQADRVMKSAKNVQAYETAKQELVDLFHPSAGWNSFPIDHFEGGQAVLENGAAIGGGRFEQVNCGATELVLGACTIGPDIEARAKELASGGEIFHGFLLDGMASWAVGCILDQLDWRIRDEYTAKGFHVSIHLGPGESGWPIDDQRVLFDLLATEMEVAGIQLEPTMLMIPLKSSSFVMGVGLDPLGMEHGSSCEFCKDRETCPHSKFTTT